MQNFYFCEVLSKIMKAIASWGYIEWWLNRPNLRKFYYLYLIFLYFSLIFPFLGSANFLFSAHSSLYKWPRKFSNLMIRKHPSNITGDLIKHYFEGNPVIQYLWYVECLRFRMTYPLSCETFFFIENLAHFDCSVKRLLIYKM